MHRTQQRRQREEFVESHRHISAPPQSSSANSEQPLERTSMRHQRMTAQEVGFPATPPQGSPHTRHSHAVQPAMTRRRNSIRTVRRATPNTKNLLICFCLFLVSYHHHPTAPSLVVQAAPTDVSSSSLLGNTIPPAPSGPIGDTVCRTEDLEQANDVQLYEILQGLKRTEFFRTFVVDLEHTCPLDKGSTEEFQCGGGGGSGESGDGSHGTSPAGLLGGSAPDEDDDDDDDEPLCTVQGGGSSGGDSSKNPFSALGSNALTSLQSSGFQSKSQEETFAWTKVTDEVFTELDGEGNGASDSFWKDMCNSIGLTQTAKTVNLALNPERNTGYNGTHIWRAIYEENCSVGAKNSTGIDNSTDSQMCLEERVLYRLLSGLHTSTTLSIAKHYYPPSKKRGRVTWEANPAYFMEKFRDQDDYIKNLHFSYVVMLRALSKATPFLNTYSGIDTGNAQEDATAQKLLHRLLDSSILQSCSSVFSAFDESRMFQEDASRPEHVNVRSLQQNFKGVFHNVSSILDCVQCQQCKLHGKLAMLGYGAALKVLFVKGEPPALDRNEIVALINTVVKLSESVRHVRELTTLYWSSSNDVQDSKQIQSPTSSGGSATELGRRTAASVTTPTPTIGASRAAQPPTNLPTLSTGSLTASIELVDTAVGLVAELGRQKVISFDDEQEIVQMALERNPDLLILAKHYSTDLDKFWRLLSRNLLTMSQKDPAPDAIVIGSGLAGLAATLNLLDRGGRVILIEKEHSLGGNSNKASSGINACCPSFNETSTTATGDSEDIFLSDTTRSAGTGARPELISTLVSNSAQAVEFLRSRAGVDLSLIAQLGGHSSKRTHRPSNGMAGAEIIYGMQKAVKAYVKTGEVTILMDTKVTELLTQADGSVIGVSYVNANSPDAESVQIHAPNVVLATGGFAADRSTGSYLDQHRPELRKMPTTAGLFSTGDGITLASKLGAGMVDMDKVQIHPTGWVDPEDPANTSKVLAAELMRGVGGILINDNGERFCNELGTRAYVTDKMLQHDPDYAKSGNWSIQSTVPSFSLVLSSSAATDGKKHVDLYSHKGLLTRLEGVAALSKWIGLSKAKVVAAIKKYQSAAAKGTDEFGKTSFRGVPDTNLEKEVFYAGRITPVLHYCMGGITIDSEGSVLNESGEIIPGLHAAGEVSGGVHGVNRLGGNSLLECTVFGTIVGQKLPIQQTNHRAKLDPEQVEASKAPVERRKVPASELELHNTKEDCWVAIHGTVYDLTEFAEEHPAGPESIHDLAGKDGTDAFSAVHNIGMLDEFDEEIVGVYAP